MFLFLVFLLCEINAISFKEWISLHKKAFSPIEYLRRRAVFIENTKYVNEMNKQNLGFTLSNEGPFAVLTREESVAITQGIHIDKSDLEQYKPLKREITEAIDYRNIQGKNYMTPVKDQGNCGSCYAFSSVALMETAVLLSYDDLSPSNYSLSTAEIVSCCYDPSECRGCEGGSIGGALKYAQDNGMQSESSFPYKPFEQHCLQNQKVMRVKKYTHSDTKGDDEKVRSEILSYGPVGSAMDASRSSFLLYHGGIYNDKRCRSDKSTIAVVIVGYGIDKNNGKYFIVRNNWGPFWGEQGYFRISSDNNLCGLSNDIYYIESIERLK
ncbi:hypothetical protein ENUP19_0063G0050 [Entamoeba nuttalli]|uniref:Cysteine protease, putative n=2 Tax=Entamoeba nuttalli TaxID=412467 RepID=K2GJQ9_ENTNP|nr:cysteine protease, putative [Entamoeba nuttalli P19]EKE43031.1 cysteine protease, putative [Entamoeba nuttalli P19]|eukprot:XP_008854637.1 cysteine protease, putative [Entamoeba nuttalli P19]